MVCVECGEAFDERLVYPNSVCVGCGRAERQKQERAARLRRESGIEPRHADLKTWDDLDRLPLPEPAAYWDAVERVREFLNARWSSVLFLIGRRGTGKTAIASVAVQLAIEHDRPARIIRAADLLTDLKGRWGDGEQSTSEADWMREWSAPWLLVIDELAERSSSAWAGQTITLLVDKRYALAVKTIVVANTTPEELQADAGASIVDRAREGGGVIECTWPSLRLAAYSFRESRDRVEPSPGGLGRRVASATAPAGV